MIWVAVPGHMPILASQSPGPSWNTWTRRRSNSLEHVAAWLLALHHSSKSLAVWWKTGLPSSKTSGAVAKGQESCSNMLKKVRSSTCHVFPWWPWRLRCEDGHVSWHCPAATFTEGCKFCQPNQYWLHGISDGCSKGIFHYSPLRISGTPWEPKKNPPILKSR